MTAWSPAITAPWPNDATSGAAGRTETIESIAESPTAYVGQSVTVGGYVANVFGQQSFVLEDGDLLGAEEVLVVTRQPAADLPGLSNQRGLSTEGYVWVSGTVHQFNRAAFEEQFGVQLDDPRLDDWAGRPAIMAGSLIPVRWGAGPRPPMAGAPAAIETAEPAAQSQPATEAGQPSAASGDLLGSSGIDAILNAPESYVGETTTIVGQIGQVVAPGSFVLSDADAESEQMLVVGTPSLVGMLTGDDGTPNTGQAVEVTGEIWRFDLGAIEQRLGIDLDDSLFAAWTDQPVMLATSVDQTPR